MINSGEAMNRKEEIEALASEFECLRSAYKASWLVKDTSAFHEFCFANSDQISAALRASAAPEEGMMATPQEVQEACAQVADRAAESDEEYGSRYDDERDKYGERAHRARTIAKSIRALIPPVLPSDSGKAAPGAITEAMINAAAREMWNDRDARHGGSWDSRDPQEVVVIQTKATAKAALLAALAPATEEWRHKKRGSTYTVVCRAELQAEPSADLCEGDKIVVYRGNDGKY